VEGYRKMSSSRDLLLHAGPLDEPPIDIPPWSIPLMSMLILIRLVKVSDKRREVKVVNRLRRAEIKFGTWGGYLHVTPAPI